MERSEGENQHVEENSNSKDGSICGYDSLHHLLSANLKPHVFKEVSRLLLGLNCGRALELVALPESAKALSSEHDFDLQLLVVRVGLIQNSIALPSTASFLDRMRAIFQKLKPIIDAAGSSRVNILCLKIEAWMVPFAFCAREKRWCEFAEPVDGESTQFLQEYRDLNHGQTHWNTAIIIGNQGNIIGKHRKNHIPRVGDFNESTYYVEGNSGHPVHHPLHWLAFGLNGAEIVFNPSATVGELNERMWPIEFDLNQMPTPSDGKPQHTDFGHFYGSSQFSAPNASCRPSLSRYKDGLLISEMDLNLCRQLKDKWGFRMTAYYKLYADMLAHYLKPGFEP
ncbi:hypothetical protein P3X46_024724 [Hevea brasiliensis]|uniref:CN hydrolase domain-containing protein n=1 Tax=Hevea brasiliensis TaxID=3981 RepID=A0ABQ9L3I4_HEVBR|nr:hypothetical protein P3X46_024724 [Hevea brasiliensis]